MNLIQLRERIDIALHCLEAAKVAFEPLKHELQETFPPQVVDLKSQLDDIVDNVYTLMSDYQDEYETANNNSRLKIVS